MGEILFTVGMLVVFGIFQYGVVSIDTGRSVDPVGAAFVPQMVILLGGLLCLATLIMQIKRYMAAQEKPCVKCNTKVLIRLGMLVVFLFVLDLVGFHLSAMLLFFGIMLLLGKKSYLNSVITAAVSASVFVVLFGRILSVPLPRGEGIFRILSHWLF